MNCFIHGKDSRDDDGFVSPIGPPNPWNPQNSLPALDLILSQLPILWSHFAGSSRSREGFWIGGRDGYLLQWQFGSWVGLTVLQSQKISGLPWSSFPPEKECCYPYYWISLFRNRTSGVQEMERLFVEDRRFDLWDKFLDLLADPSNLSC